MPFATLPSSPGFSPPQAPDWTRFAEQANQMIANRPLFNTGEAIDKAVNQISEILKMSSPEAKFERMVHMQQLGALHQLYTDYQQHPGNYQMTAHGPVLIDPIARNGRIAQLNHTMMETAYLRDKLTKGQDNDTFIKTYMPKLKTAMNAESQGVALQKGDNPQANYTPVGNPDTNTNTNTEDATADQILFQQQPSDYVTDPEDNNP